MNETNFGLLGSSFQKSLIKLLFVDTKFTVTIIDVIESKYFDGPYFKYIVENLKELYHQYGIVPSFDNVKEKIVNESDTDSDNNIHFDTLNDIVSHEIHNEEWVKDVTINFCKQQVLKRDLKKIQKIIEKGRFEEYNDIEGIIQEALRIGVNDENITDIFNFEEALKENSRVGLPTGIKGLDQALKGGLAKGELGIVIAPTGIGKELPVSEPVLTPDGWVQNGSLKIGDKVIGSNGEEQFVIGVYPQGKKPIYKMEFTDDTFVYCGLDHLWSVNTLESGDVFEVISTRDMIPNIKKGEKYNYKLPIVNPINYPKKDVEFEPYMLGEYLGYGFLKKETKERIFQNFFNKNSNNIFNELYIPKEYLFNNIETRVALLQGIVDSDSIINKEGFIEIITPSKTLSEDLKQLVLSLGGFVKCKTIHRDSFNIYINTLFFNNEIIPTRLNYKLNYTKITNDHSFQKYVCKITYSHDEEASCIKVSNSDELYVTRNYVLTHNTTLLTLFANSSFNFGVNVLQIFFEDNVSSILRKHYTIWTGISPEEQYSKKEEVVEILNEIKKGSKNELKLLKLPSDSITVSEIKTHLRKLKAEGFKPDLIIIDYVDCIVPEKGIYNEEWKGEGAIMRSLENMTQEFDTAMWVATQGNRASISSEVVTTDQMGGSIKKAQIGHVVISVGKTLEQKTNKMATMTLLKSRIGDDGIVYSNCLFDNEYLRIDTDSSNTLLGFKEDRAEQNKKYAAELYKQRQEQLEK